MGNTKERTFKVSRSRLFGHDIAMVTFGDLGAKFSYTRFDHTDKPFGESSWTPGKHRDETAGFSTLVEIRLSRRFPTVRMHPNALWARVKDNLVGASDFQLGNQKLDEYWNIQGAPIGWTRLILRARGLTEHPALLRMLRGLDLTGQELKLSYGEWVNTADDIRARMEAIQTFIDSISKYFDHPKALFENQGFRVVDYSVSKGFECQRIEEGLVVTAKFYAATEMFHAHVDFEPIEEDLFCIHREGTTAPPQAGNLPLHLVKTNHPILERTVRIYGSNPDKVSKLMTHDALVADILPLLHGYPGSTLTNKMATVHGLRMKPEEMLQAIEALTKAVSTVKRVATDLF